MFLDSIGTYSLKRSTLMLGTMAIRLHRYVLVEEICIDTGKWDL